MKLRTTQKEIRAYKQPIYAIGYCNLQHLLDLGGIVTPLAYTAGTMGWGCDVYDVNGVILTTGYSPFGTHVPFEIVEKYDVLATQSSDNLDKKRQLLAEFVAEIQEATKCRRTHKRK